MTARFPLTTGAGEARADIAYVDSVVDPGAIRDQLRQIADEMGQLFIAPLGLPLKTLEVDLTLTAEGSVSFLGTGGKVTGEGSIKLTFERPES